MGRRTRCSRWIIEQKRRRHDSKNNPDFLFYVKPSNNLTSSGNGALGEPWRHVLFVPVVPGSLGRDGRDKKDGVRRRFKETPPFLQE